MNRAVLKVNFRHHQLGEERQFLKLLELAGMQNIQVVQNEISKSDLSFCGPYHGGIGDYNLEFLKRLKRGFVSKTGPGRHLLKKNLAGGIQPNEKAKRNIWFTGENQRPPFGEWDGYFSFEPDDMHGRNVYWPQAWLATNFLDKNITNTPWNSVVLDVSAGLKPRQNRKFKKLKFAVAFLGKVHPSRLHFLSALGEIGKIDIYGLASRRPVKSKIEIAKNYKFVICPENDLYPGYVTEKAIEAYVSECVPIYSGLDSLKILNRNAMVNYAESLNETRFLSQVSKLHFDEAEYQQVYRQPIFGKRPSYARAVEKIREILDS